MADPCLSHVANDNVMVSQMPWCVWRPRVSAHAAAYADLQQAYGGPVPKSAKRKARKAATEARLGVIASIAQAIPASSPQTIALPRPQLELQHPPVPPPVLLAPSVLPLPDPYPHPHPPPTLTWTPTHLPQVQPTALGSGASGSGASGSGASGSGARWGAQ